MRMQMMLVGAAVTLAACSGDYEPIRGKSVENPSPVVVTPANVPTSKPQIGELEWLKPGVEYKRYADGSCKVQSTTERCISEAEYQEACGHVKGITQIAISMLRGTLSEPYSTLAGNGGASYTSTAWGKSLGGSEACFVQLHFEGMVKGNSVSLDRGVRVNSFIRSTETGEVLIRYAN